MYLPLLKHDAQKAFDSPLICVHTAAQIYIMLA